MRPFSCKTEIFLEIAGAFQEYQWEKEKARGWVTPCMGVGAEGFEFQSSQYV